MSSDEEDTTAATVPLEERIPVSTANYRLEQDRDSTGRPVLDATTRTGTHFEAMDDLECPLVVRPLPPTPLQLLQLFIPVSLVEQWVSYTNNPATTPMGPLQENAHQNAWKKTSVAEVYLWLAVLIYMLLHREFRYNNYRRTPWTTANDEDGFRHLPSHPIIQYITYNRWLLLKRRLRLDDPDSIEHRVPRPYCTVNEWANALMAASMATVIISSQIAVDEAICGFLGHSKQKVTIPTKPTPTGLKV